MSDEQVQETSGVTDMSHIAAAELPQVSDAEMNAMLGIDNDTMGARGAGSERGAGSAAAVAQGASTEKETPASTEVAAAEEADPIAAAITERASKADKRDFTGIDEQDIPLFKQMSTSAFEKAKAWYTAAKSAGDLPSKYEALNKEHAELSKYRFAGHPESYRFADEYKEIEGRQADNEALLSHWTKQLEAIEGGQLTFTNPVQDAKGNWKLEPIQLTEAELPRAKVWMQTQLQEVYANRKMIDSEIANLKNDFSQRNTKLDADLDNLYKETLGKYEQHLKAAADKHLAAFPKHFTAFNPHAAKLLAYSLSALEVLASGGQRATAAKTAVERTAKNAGPTATKLDVGSPNATGNRKLKYDETEYKEIASLMS